MSYGLAPLLYPPPPRCLFEPDWVSIEFPSLLSSRHSALTGYHAHPSGDKVSLVEAVGLARLVRVWEECGCDWVPVGVVCEGGDDSYDVPDNVVCSLPARCVSGEWVVVKGIPLKDEIKVCCFFKYESTEGLFIHCCSPLFLQESLSKQVKELKTELDNAIEKLKTDRP